MYSSTLQNNIIEFSLDIHPTAIVDPNAKIGRCVSIGPYSIIGPNVSIGDNCKIASHVLIEGWTVIEHSNDIRTGAIIGTTPQDLKFKGEESFLEIGHGNIIREYATINRGTKGGGGLTRIGNNNLLMASSHVAHDAVIKNNCVIAHAALVGGHAVIENGASLAASSGVHQFCRIGEYAMVGAWTPVTKDVAPYTIVKGHPPKLKGLNFERLKRLKISSTEKGQLKKAYNVIFNSNLILSESLRELEYLRKSSIVVGTFLRFFDLSKRGTYR